MLYKRIGGLAKLTRRNISKYSFINPDPTLKSNLMAFGYECDNGWIPLIEEFFDKIESILDGNKDLYFQVLQVKEKFGTLRIYVYGGNEEINDLIELCTDKSAETCEICGNFGTLRDRNRWYKTLCDAHYKEWA